MTDINAIRDFTMVLFDSVPIKPLLGGIVVQHPFTNSMTAYNPHSRKMLDLSKAEDVAEYRGVIKDFIYSHDLPSLFSMINHPWLLTWFKYASQDMDKKDFAKYLKASWVQEENPNQDCNVSRKEAIGYFRNADKKYLMSSEDLSHYKNLPETVTVYRGVAVGREKYGLSWTNNTDIAEWFRKRFDHNGKEGYLLKATVSKKHILAYFNNDLRGEEELVVDVFSIKDKIKEVK